MRFDSYTFAVFMAMVLLLHRILPWRAGRVMLVVASYIFYGWAYPWYCLLLLASTLTDFLVAMRISAARNSRVRLGLLGVSLGVNLGLLFAFKYGAFVVDTLSDSLLMLGAGPLEPPAWVLPIGISFYTFQTLSYTIDVFYNKVAPQREFISFALYVAFFPQLVAGPIERSARLMPQFEKKAEFRWDDLEQGFQRILWGVVKKAVVADRLAVFVDAVYAAPEEAGGSLLATATFCFVMQAYLDFSAYCDIALGSARMFGIRLRENFRWPLLARNPIDFWARWHLTLGEWFRDYLLTALIGRKRPGRSRKLFNLFVVLTLMGLWHGPAWHFVPMGFWAGGAVVLYQAAVMAKGGRPGGRLLGESLVASATAVALNTFHVFVLTLLFRAKSVGQAWAIGAGMLRKPWAMGAEAWVYLAIAIGAWLFSVAHSRLHTPRRREIRLAPPLRAVFWAAMILAALYGAVDTRGQFIYFQF